MPGLSGRIAALSTSSAKRDTRPVLAQRSAVQPAGARTDARSSPTGGSFSRWSRTTTAAGCTSWRRWSTGTGSRRSMSIIESCRGREGYTPTRLACSPRPGCRPRRASPRSRRRTRRCMRACTCSRMARSGSAAGPGGYRRPAVPLRRGAGFLDDDVRRSRGARSSTPTCYALWSAEVLSVLPKRKRPPRNGAAVSRI